MPKHAAHVQQKRVSSDTSGSFFGEAGPYRPGVPGATSREVDNQRPAAQRLEQSRASDKARQMPAPQEVIASPAQRPYAMGADSGTRNERAGSSSAAYVLLRILTGASRILAVVYLVLTVLDVVVTTGMRASLIGPTTMLARLLPESLSGALVIQTPSGGALRGDFIVAAVCLFIIGHIFHVLATRAERG